MFRLFAFAVAVLALAGAAAADDKKKDAPNPAFSGTWTREANGLDLKAEFVGKDTFKYSVFAGADGVIATCKYTAGKDGAAKAKVTKVEFKGDFKAKVPEGLEFTFKWTVKGDTGTLDDFKVADLDEAKAAVEGEYVRKKAKE